MNYLEKQETFVKFQDGKYYDWNFEFCIYKKKLYRHDETNGKLEFFKRY